MNEDRKQDGGKPPLWFYILWLIEYKSRQTLPAAWWGRSRRIEEARLNLEHFRREFLLDLEAQQQQKERREKVQ